LTISPASKIRLQKLLPRVICGGARCMSKIKKGEKSVFTTTLTLEERIARAQAQLTKAKYPLISD